jgi:hypothetical protein
MVKRFCLTEINNTGKLFGDSAAPLEAAKATGHKVHEVSRRRIRNVNTVFSVLFKTSTLRNPDHQSITNHIHVQLSIYR